jgi:hypothetical protein
MVADRRELQRVQALIRFKTYKEDDSDTLAYDRVIWMAKIGIDAISET